ncbi:hypothetical protein K438DRAFT_1818478 [Mycena galopus ATCC 62051]|nr:hypothetical protein K438DRAFT_1818478 [Mycena galopus ATCC 62051]
MNSLMPPKHKWPALKPLSDQPRWSALGPLDSVTVANTRDAFDLRTELVKSVSWKRCLKWQERAHWALHHPEAATASDPNRRAYFRLFTKFSRLRRDHRVYGVGQTITRFQLIELQQWVSRYDGANAPLLVIETDSMLTNSLVPSNALAVGIDGHFYLDLSAKTFISDDFLLDVIRGICGPHVNLFGNRKRVFVERLLLGHEDNCFEYLGEFEVDVKNPLAGKRFWQHLISDELKGRLLLHYQSTLGEIYGQFINKRFCVDSEVRCFFNNGDFAPCVSLTPYETECFYIAMPLHGGFPDSDPDPGSDSDYDSVDYDSDVPDSEFADDIFSSPITVSSADDFSDNEMPLYDGIPDLDLDSHSSESDESMDLDSDDSDSEVGSADESPSPSYTNKAIFG